MHQLETERHILSNAISLFTTIYRYFREFSIMLNKTTRKSKEKKILILGTGYTTIFLSDSPLSENSYSTPSIQKIKIKTHRR